MSTAEVPLTLPPQTPPHHPTYGVQMSVRALNELVTKACPGYSLTTVNQLGTGKSYNNRLYFLEIRRTGTTQQQDSQPAKQDLVLKVNGRFFGPEKIQNEVSCLRILESCCPGVPSPRVWAWSEDGLEFVTATNALQSHSLSSTQPPDKHGGWILMTKVPGESLGDIAAGLSSDDSTRLVRELAGYVTMWRHLVAAQRHCGNLRFHKDYTDAVPTIRLDGSGVQSPLDIVIRGIVGEAIVLPGEIDTLYDYYKVKLQDKLRQLASNNVYARNRFLHPSVESFMSNDLPTIDILGRAVRDDFIFTHCDLSPRNILVSGSPYKITGIVDFEFAGFFSELEEFLNDSVGNKGDWPEDSYNAYLEQLEQSGVHTPVRGISKAVWEQAYCLEELLQNIAPWWLPGEHAGTTLDAELDRCGTIVQTMLSKLSEAKTVRESGPI